MTPLAFFGAKESPRVAAMQRRRATTKRWLVATNRVA